MTKPWDWHGEMPSVGMDAFCSILGPWVLGSGDGLSDYSISGQ